MLLSELVGDEPLAEGILETTADAARRFLRPGGVLVPSGLQLLATPLQLPRDERESAVIGRARVRRWRAWYGLDFSPLLDVVPLGGFDLIDPLATRSWRQLGPPVVVADYELRSAVEAPVDPVPLRVDRPGRLDAVILHFELRAEGRTFLSTAPADVEDDNHWQSPVRYLRRPPLVGRESRSPWPTDGDRRPGRSPSGCCAGRRPGRGCHSSRAVPDRGGVLWQR